MKVVKTKRCCLGTTLLKSGKFLITPPRPRNTEVWYHTVVKNFAGLDPVGSITLMPFNKVSRVSIRRWCFKIPFLLVVTQLKGEITGIFENPHDSTWNEESS